MAITNKLKLRFQHTAIDKYFDIFQLTSSDKFIPKGARLLDLPSLNNDIRSLVFDNGKNAFILVNKGKIDRQSLVKTIDNEQISFKSISSSEIKDYILIRLFLFSLANYQKNENQYNNLTGKLYINLPQKKKDGKKSITVLSIDVDSNLCVLADIVTFVDLSLFKSISKEKYPTYSLLPNGKLKREFSNNEKSKLYVKKGIPGQKASYPFLVLKPGDIQQTRAFHLINTINKLNNYYHDFLEVNFDELPLNNSVGARRDSDFVERAINKAKERETIIVDLVKDSSFKYDLQDLKEKLDFSLNQNVSFEPNVIKGKNNIVFIHDKSYYTTQDPHNDLPREEVVQCLTAEDGLKQLLFNNRVVLNTIIKEIAIKGDLIDKTISLDNWEEFHFSHDWIFGSEVNDTIYFMIIHPSGTFSLHKSHGLIYKFDLPILNDLTHYFLESDRKQKTLISDNNGNIILISRTSQFCLPNPELFSLKTISRSKESRKKYLEGLIDINLFKTKNECFYNVGLIGSGMNTKLENATILYKVDVLKGENILPSLLQTMSVLFVKYNSFTVLPYPIKYLREYIETNITE